MGKETSIEHKGKMGQTPKPQALASGSSLACCIPAPPPRQGGGCVAKPAPAGDKSVVAGGDRAPPWAGKGVLGRAVTRAAQCWALELVYHPSRRGQPLACPGCEPWGEDPEPHFRRQWSGRAAGRHRAPWPRLPALPFLPEAAPLPDTGGWASPVLSPTCPGCRNSISLLPGPDRTPFRAV